MRSAFAAFLRGFILPFGATSGTRIVFDGTNGRIEFYDADNLLVVLIDPTGVQVADGNWSGTPPSIAQGETAKMLAGTGSIQFGDNPPTDQTRGSIQASITGTTDRLLIRGTKRVAVGTRAELQLRTTAAGVKDAVFLIDTLNFSADCMVAAVGPVGNVIGKVDVRNSAGTIVGFLPVYDTIT